MWSEGQERWTAVSSASELITAEEAGHYIHVDQPDASFEAIERVRACHGAGRALTQLSAGYEPHNTAHGRWHRARP